MTRIRSTSSLTVAAALAAVLIASLAAPAMAQGPGYGTPSYAPDWFKYCTNPKQWAYWTLDNQGVLTMTDWGNNYGSVLETPVVVYQPELLSVRMDNDPRPDHYKQVWFQAIWAWTGATPSAGPLTLHWGGPPGAIALFAPQSSPVGPGLGQGFYVNTAAQTVTFYWEIFPQPDWERLSLYYSGVVFTDVMMLTQCNPIPEPVFFQMGALLGLSGLGLLKLRRR